MFSYKQVLNTVVAITSPYPNIRNEFETSFRNTFSSLDINVLLSGTVPAHITPNLIAEALQRSSALALELHSQTGDAQYQRVSFELWNPLVRELLKVISKHSCTIVPEKRTMKKSVKNLTLVNAFEALSTDEVKEDLVVKELLQVGKSSVLPFNTPFHKHIMCKRESCKFCRELFYTVNLTRCVGHRKCTQIGFYPHVGPSLWNIVRSRHKKDTPLLLKERPLRPGEIKALRHHLVMPSSSKTILDIAGETTKSMAPVPPLDWNLLSDIESPGSPPKKLKRNAH
jgi:hypothetical protein